MWNTNWVLWRNPGAKERTNQQSREASTRAMSGLACSSKRLKTVYNTSASLDSCFQLAARRWGLLETVLVVHQTRGEPWGTALNSACCMIPSTNHSYTQSPEFAFFVVAPVHVETGCFFNAPVKFCATSCRQLSPEQQDDHTVTYRGIQFSTVFRNSDYD